MLDGQGKKLSEDEVEKVKAAIKPKQDVSLNQVSVDPATTGISGADSDGEHEDQVPASTEHNASI